MVASGLPILWDFFIVHTSDDAETAAELYHLLSAHHRVFLDKYSISAGADWGQAIVSALAATRVFVVLVTTQGTVGAAPSPYLDDEIARAVELTREDARRRMVPVVLDGQLRPEQRLPYGLASKQYLDLQDRGVQGIAEDLQKVHQELAPATVPSSVPRSALVPARNAFSPADAQAPVLDAGDEKLIDSLINLLKRERRNVFELLKLPRASLDVPLNRALAHDLLKRATRQNKVDQLEALLKTLGAERRRLRDRLEAQLAGLLEAEFNTLLRMLDRDSAPGTPSYVRAMAAGVTLPERIGKLMLHAERLDLLDQIEPIVEKVAAAATARRDGPEAEVIQAWRRHTERQHERLIPFFPDAVGELFDRVFVTIDVERIQGAVFDGITTLYGLLSESFRDSAASRSASLIAGASPMAEGSLDQRGVGRWVVIGDPGSGKTTLARHVARQLARSSDAPIPVYLPLSRLIASSKHPFAAAEAELLTAIGPGGAGLCDALFRVAKRQGQIWLMLDGFDEVAPQSVATAIDRIKSWERELPHVVIAVLSRPIGYRSLEPEFGHARVRPLSVASQRELLGRWCSPPLAERAWALLDEPRSRLRAIIPNPLMLTLVAMLANERRTLPLNRVQLYENAIDLLLRRGHCADPRGVRDRIAARHILGQLSCVLQEGTEELWSENTLHNHLIALGSRDPTIRNLLEPWDSPADFLEDISRNSGLIGPHDGPREPWRYLHRSLREFLVAEALSKESDIAIDNRIAVLRNDNAGRWGEPIALLCGLASNPLALLHKIQSFNSDLALRAILNAEGIKPSDAAQFVHATGQSLQHLERIARIWVASKEHEDLERTRELLMLMVQPSLDIRDLAIVHLVMERVGLPPDRKAFFAGAFRPLPRGHSLPAMVRVPGGSFTMGLSAPEMKSPFDTPEKQETVESFEIAVTPTTESQYQQFASAFGLDWRPGQPSSDGPVLPAVNVTWWEAYLFSCWLGYALPTEVEWEYACRAGTTTTFCSGDTVADLDRVGWYKSNSGGHVHPVGEKQPNQFGLYDMHGNVWEWCSDPTGSSDDEIFGENYWCVLRGGSWFNEAQRARSADRGSWPAGKHYPMIGFRLVRR